MNKVIEMPKVLCEECKIREAARLCDFDIGYNIDLDGPGKTKRVTCDKKLCIQCAHKINNKDYCTEHLEEMRKELLEGK